MELSKLEDTGNDVVDANNNDNEQLIGLNSKRHGLSDSGDVGLSGKRRPPFSVVHRRALVALGVLVALTLTVCVSVWAILGAAPASEVVSPAGGSPGSGGLKPLDQGDAAVEPHAGAEPVAVQRAIVVDAARRE